MDSEPVGSLAAALAHGARLLERAPALAAEQAREILAAAPGHPQAALLLGAALRAARDTGGACAVLQRLVEAAPDWPAAQAELGLALADAGRSAEAVAALRAAVKHNPHHGQAWRALGDQLSLLGDTAGADVAYARHLASSVKDPRLVEAAQALCDNRLAVVERSLRALLKQHPTDVGAIRMLAEVAGRLGRYQDAETLLARCLELAPGFAAARHNYALVLHRQGKAVEALAEVETLLAKEPGHPAYVVLKAAALGRIGEYAKAVDAYETVLAHFPEQPRAWTSYGHALKTLGRQDEAIAAYRRALALQPGMGEAWWSLANLKTVRFSAEDIEIMRAQADRADLADDDRCQLDFALGKALEDLGEAEAAFARYSAGNALRRRSVDYDAEENRSHVDRSKALFTEAFFAQRAGWGCPEPDPIFVVGLPRAGSTLIEQILSSHSQVEGTMELPDVIALAKRLGGKRPMGAGSAYPEVLAELDADALRALGEEYLERTRVQRKTGRPFFIDKMPNNFAHVGLIRLMLPNARIVDARRHPLGCCFSGFKQHFARGQGFTYDLAELGRYYADYVELMAWFDRVQPGAVHRVIYERMVADPESQVRALLDYCGLPFEEGCLRFYETERAVRTASSEQVRRPIFKDAVEHWRAYEPWLGELKAALGPVLGAYPEPPEY